MKKRPDFEQVINTILLFMTVFLITILTEMGI